MSGHSPAETGLSGDSPATTRLSDADARHEVEHRLEATLFVEAGAGSGKTTALVARIVRLICSGRCELSELAAVTFTEAAAAELRVRVRDRLTEVTLRKPAELGGTAESRRATEDECRRAGEALDHIDEAAISTIHGFCQRLLAEYPIEAGLPPRLEVLDEVKQSLEWQRQWSDALDDFGDDAGICGLFKVASLLSITRVEELARGVAEEWDRGGTVRPDGRAVVAAVEGIVTGATATVIEALDSALEYARHCLDPLDKLALRLAEVQAYRDFLVATSSWEDQLAALVARDRLGGQIGQKGAWACDVNEIRAYLDVADAARGGALQECCDLVLPALVAVADVLARSLAEQRRASGRLTFQDLLVLTRDLLVQQPTVLASVRRRLRYLLVDEFQDTDPLQLEIAELIAFGRRRTLDGITVLGEEVGLGPAGGAGVSTNEPRSDAGAGGEVHNAGSDIDGSGAASTEEPGGDAGAGRLFFVGDPQQSIYRFRGADPEAYVAARERLASGGTTKLTSNFRSVPGILDFVNECFTSMIGPGFSRLDPVRQDAGSGPPVRIVGGPFPDGKLRRFAQREIESEACAEAIERAVRHEKWMVDDQPGGPPRSSALRPARFSDVAVLVPRRTGLDQIEAALDAHGIGFRVESASLIFRSQEVRNLLALCRAIDAPGDELALVAALRSPAFACGDDDLRAYREIGGRWSIDGPFRLSPPASPASQFRGEGRDPSVVAEALVKLASYRARRYELGPIGVLELAVRDRRLLQLATTTPRVRESWRRVRFLLERARAFVSAGGGGLTEFADWVDEQLSEGLRAVESVLPEPDEDVVHILTVHGAKGLEFPIVVLAGFGTTDAVSGPTGPRVLRGDDGVEVRFRKGTLETSGYGPLFALRQLREREEAVRVLYVAATRARDHLIFGAHHLRPAGGVPSLGQSLYESASAACADRPHLCEFVDPGVPGGQSGPGQGALFRLDELAGGADSSGGRAPDGRAPGAEGSATEGPATRQDADNAAGVSASPPPTEAAGSSIAALRWAYLKWRADRAELIEKVSSPSGIRATDLAALADLEARAAAGAGARSVTDAGREGEVTDGRPGARDGSRVGRAVHATLQSISVEAAREVATAPSADCPELRRLAAARSRAERIAGRAGEVEQLARLALSCPSVRAAFCSETLHRELYVSVKLDGVVLDGFIDLCFEDEDRLVVVDYKTDRVRNASELEAVAARYGLQAAAYALALGAAAGKPVRRCVLVFLRSQDPIEHEVAGLGALMDDVRAVVAGAARAGAGGAARDGVYGAAPDNAGAYPENASAEPPDNAGQSLPGSADRSR